MKRIVMVAALALAGLGLSEQKANAWCSFNFNAGINLSFQSGGCRIGHNGFLETQPFPSCNPCCISGCETGPALPAPQEMPSVPPMQPAPKTSALPTQSSTQQVGYYYWSNQANYGYGNYGYNAPSYWYDR